MKQIVKMVLFVMIFTLISCSNPSGVENENDINIKDGYQIGENVGYSLTRTWYYNPDDDRYFFLFTSDGIVFKSYYQSIGGTYSGLNGFVTKRGTWSYRNDEKTKFSICWNNEVPAWYIIVSEDDEKMVVKGEPNSPLGSGLGSCKELLKHASKYEYDIPDEIKELMGIWFYDSSKEGKYLEFKPDGTCYYHHYQSIGGFNGTLDGWVNSEGLWKYSTSSKVLSVTMHGEITYSYIIDGLSDTMMRMRVSGNAGSSSTIYSNELFYKK